MYALNVVNFHVTWDTKDDSFATTGSNNYNYGRLRASISENSQTTKCENSQARKLCSLSHLLPASHKCAAELCHPYFRQWFAVCSAPSHYVNHWWLLINNSPRNRFQRYIYIKLTSFHLPPPTLHTRTHTHTDDNRQHLLWWNFAQFSCKSEYGSRVPKPGYEAKPSVIPGFLRMLRQVTQFWQNILNLYYSTGF